MRIIDASYEVLSFPSLSIVELAGRTCYKSEDRITQDSEINFITKLIRSGHESVLEHVTATVRFIVDRGVSHELVRHRLAAYSQESTRYCNYSKGKFDGEITVIRPCWYPRETFETPTDMSPAEHKRELRTKYDELFLRRAVFWKFACEESEHSYMQMLRDGASPQEARSVLPNSLKTEVVATMNMRQWRHVLAQRTSKAAHPQMREVMVPLLKHFADRDPVLFNDISEGVKE